MAYANINLVYLFIMLEWYYFLIPFYHPLSYNFWSCSYPNFPPVYHWVGYGMIFCGFRFDFRILVSSGGTVKSPKLISSPSDAGVFWEGHEFGGGLSKSAKFMLHFCLFLTHISIAVRWEGRER